jgi:ribonuclease VapC
MRLAALLDVAPTAADALVTRLLREAEIEIVPINEEVAHSAVAAFERYGKGRKNRAGLNFGDCLSYACAQTHGARLLFKGTDFAQTDIIRA